MSLNKFGYALILSLMVFAAPAMATTLYSQASDGTACDTSCWTSSYGAEGPESGGYQTFDDFSLSSNATVTEVSWYGFYIDGDEDGANPATPATANWLIGFFADDGSLPGTALYTTSLAASSVTAQFLGDTSALGDTVPFYEFTAALPTGFAATAGTTYWFSPLSEQATFEPFFSWSPSSVGDGYSAQLQLPGSVNLYQDALYTVAGDRAFTLSGTTAAPEPSTWALMLAGIGGVGLVLRRGRRGKLATA